MQNTRKQEGTDALQIRKRVEQQEQRRSRVDSYRARPGTSRRRQAPIRERRRIIRLPFGLFVCLYVFLGLLLYKARQDG